MRRISAKLRRLAKNPHHEPSAVNEFFRLLDKVDGGIMETINYLDSNAKALMRLRRILPEYSDHVSEVMKHLSKARKSLNDSNDSIEDIFSGRMSW